MQHRDVSSRCVSIGSLAAVALVLATPGADAQTVEEFYRGRNITLVVSSGAGSGYDVYSRMLARHITKHIPGQPRIVVRNMPGASGIKAVNYLANIAERDGSVFSDTYSTMPLYPLLDGQGAAFDTMQLNWLGSINRAISVCITWHTTTFKTLDDVMQREMRISATGVGGWRVIVPRMFNAVAGTKFRVIMGYGPNEDYLAVERGEVEGSCTTYDTLQAVQIEWLRQRKVRFIAQFGLQPTAGLEGAAMALERIKDPEDRKAVDLIMSQQEYGRPFAAPPNVPADRVQALRSAFDETIKDPEFRADAQKAHLGVDSLTADQMGDLVRAAYSSPPAVVQRAKAILERAQRSPNQ
jgi:tripartite-type tricarboxylate transporter receptor subunit TctC